MKPETFAQLIIDHSYDLRKFGYNTGAQNEIHAQGVIDYAIKTRWGASTASLDEGGTKIREINYLNPTLLGKTADFMVNYIRPSSDKINNNSFFKEIPIIKRTFYLIELKSESGANPGKFSGMSWYEAFQSDIDKISKGLLGVMKIMGDTGSLRSRCFAALIAFNSKTISNIEANHKNYFKGSVFKVGNSSEGSAGALVFDQGWKL